MDMKKFHNRLAWTIDDWTTRFIVEKQIFHPKNHINDECESFMQEVSWNNLDLDAKTNLVIEEVKTNDLSLDATKDYLILLKLAKKGDVYTNKRISDFNGKYRFKEKISKRLYGLTQSIFQETFPKNSIKNMNRELDATERSARKGYFNSPYLHGAKLYAKMSGAEVLPSFKQNLKKLIENNTQKEKARMFYRI
jgi:hypothetical protein